MCKGLKIMFGGSRLFVIDLKFLEFSSYGVDIILPWAATRNNIEN